MKEATVFKIKHYLFYGLAILSAVLSLNMFWRMSNDPFYRACWMAFGFFSESMKLVLLIIAKDLIKNANGWKDRFHGFALAFLYIILALCSLIASYGFTKMSIEEFSRKMEAEIVAKVEEESLSSFSIKKARLEKNIADYDDQIRILKENSSNLGYDAVERSEESSRQLVELQDLRDLESEKLIALLDEEKAKREEENKSTSLVEVEDVSMSSLEMFELIGSGKVSGVSVLFWLMILMNLVLEISIALLSDSIERPVKIKMHSRIFEYMNLLYANGPDRLVPDYKISKEHNFSKEECYRYKNVLKTVTWKGKPLVQSKPGKTFSIMSLVNAKKVVNIYLSKINNQEDSQ